MLSILKQSYSVCLKFREWLANCLWMVPWMSTKKSNFNVIDELTKGTFN